MPATFNIQDHYRCFQCKAASDIYGRGCKHGLLFPLGLILANMNECPNYEFDANKVKESLEKEADNEKRH